MDTPAHQLSNAVVYTSGTEHPPSEIVRYAKMWLEGKLSIGYPCMDCCPNLLVFRDSKDGGWAVQRQHDATCPSNNEVMQEPT